MSITLPAPIFSPAFYRDPYPTFAHLREKTPVVRVKNQMGNPMWILTHYQAVAEALKDDRLSKKPLDGVGAEHIMPLPKVLKRFLIPLIRPLMAATIEPATHNMLAMDDPDHARLRTLVHKSFTPQYINKLQSRIELLIDKLLHQAQAKGQMEFISDFAFPLPITIIAEILGVPEQDHQKFKVWTQSVVDVRAGFHALKTLRDVANLNKYLRGLIAQKRVNPQDDMLSSLIEIEEQGEKLNDAELLSMAFLLLTAGHETTVNLLGNGLLALLRHPEQLSALRSNPAMIKTGVEELLRYDTPVLMATERYAKQDMVIGGVKIAKGEMVTAGLGAANRDPAYFSAPDTLDLTRESNRHLSFGQGIHYCLGAPLARMEAQHAFNAVLARFPKLRLAVPVEQLEWRHSMIIRGMKTMPLTF